MSGTHGLLGQPSPNSSLPGRKIVVALVYLLALAVGAPRAAQAQLGGQVPEAAYYGTIQELYSGEYRGAERDFRRLGRGGVKAAQARWIDSICYHAMLGETLYHEGRNGEALTEFDQACLLFLSYPNFLRQVQFEPPRPDANAARRAPPWGPGERQFVAGDVPRSMPIMMGRLNAAEQAIQQGGGVVLQAQFWQADVVEIIRATALAIRRRNEILGPLGKYDRISKELASTLSRGNLAPPNHWAGAWVELLAGVAKAGLGNAEEAKTHLGRAVTIANGLDHPLTCVALLEQGRLAMAAGDHRGAAQLLAAASASAYYYEDLDVLTEAAREGWANHVASGAAGGYPPLDGTAAWAQANRLWHIVATLRLAQGQQLARQGQLQEATAILEEVGRRIGDMRTGRPGIELWYLQALVNLGQQRYEPADVALRQALAAQAGASLRNFQIERAGLLYDAGDLSPRVAPDVYRALVDEPTPADWGQRTLDTLAVLATPHDGAYDRWLLASLERKDVPQALEVSDRAKRARFLTTLPFGGRLLALRAILEAPAGELDTEAALEREQLLAAFPDYRNLSADHARLVQQLRGGPMPADGARLDALQQNCDARERLLMAMALSPLPSTFLFPPLRTANELQGSLEPGAGLVVFHVAGGNFYGFVVTREGVHGWQVGDERQVERAVGDLLRAMGNYGPKREMTIDELKDANWRATAAKLYQGVFANSRLDLSRLTDLAIVPDGCLWYLPFEALVPPGGAPTVLLDRVPMHYGPTASLAVGDARPFRQARHTGIVANRLLSAAEGRAGDEALAPLEEAVSGPVRLVPPLAQSGYLVASLLDALVVLDDIELDRDDPLAWSPLPRSRGREGDSLVQWMGLPYEGPERVVLAGFPTAAENGLRAARRGAAVRPGSDVFRTVCALMASGARTLLISRWRTGGQLNLQLVREFVQELPHASADEAWQRSVLLARETPLDTAQEPRLKRLATGAEPPGADHPFFWAGYLLVDTGAPAAAGGASGAALPQAAVDEAGPAAENRAVGPPPPQEGADDPQRAKDPPSPTNPPRVGNR